MSYLIVEGRPWCKDLTSNLKAKLDCEFFVIDSKKELNLDYLNDINPRFIFFVHWSYIIPKSIYENFECVVFHMTDLPYGRGGSPLQNLIVRGHKNTMISALQCVEEIDAGPVYLKRKLSLEGKAQEIYIRANQVIEKMIVEILDTLPKPKLQTGDVVKFNRRKPEDGNWGDVESLDKVYDYIRMLDAEGYPPAFIRIGKYRLEFSNALKGDDAVNARVKIIKEKGHE